MNTIKNCPICQSNSFNSHLEVEDHFLTYEIFTLQKCNSCGLIFTSPRPKEIDIGRYYQSDEYISHSSSSKGILDKIYFAVRNHSIKKKFKLITKYISSGSILDIGCGTGEVLQYFKEMGWSTTGVEPNNTARDIATKKHHLSVFSEREFNKQNTSSFDIITMWHVLEHVSDLDARIQGIKLLIKENGILVIAVPNIDSKDAEIYGKFWGALDVPRHLYHFNHKTIKMLFQNYGFEIINIVPMKFDAYYISLISEKYKTGKSNFIKAFFNGMISNIYGLFHKNNYSSNIYLLKLKNP